MSVCRAQQEIDSREFSEWMAYEEISPGDPERADLRAALIAHTVASCMAAKKGRRFKLKDFLLRFRKGPPQRKSAKDLKTKLIAWKTGHNAQFEKDGKKKKKKRGFLRWPDQSEP